MKIFMTLIFGFLFSVEIYCQINHPTNSAVELYVGTENVIPITKPIVFYLQAVGSVWGGEPILPTEYFLTNAYNNSSWAIQTNNADNDFWRGWDFVLSRTFNPPDFPVFGWGAYKLSTNVSTAYFYLNYLDDRYGSYEDYSPPTFGHDADVWVKYDDSGKKFYFNSDGMSNWGSGVTDGQVLSIWDIKHKGVPATSKFSNFWQNCLAMGKVDFEWPHLIWGKYSGANNAVSYSLYRSFPTNGIAPTDNSNAWELIYNTTGNTTFDYKDENVYSVINDPDAAEPYIRLYYVKAHLDDQTISSRTNIVSVFSNISWSNALVMIKENNHPRLVWDTYPGAGTVSGYRIYKKLTTSSSGQITITKDVTNTTNEYIDADFSLNITSKDDFTAYWVEAKFIDNSFSSATNHVSTRGTSSIQWKKNDNAEAAAINQYSLSQNTPNPFNPSTQINYQLAANSYVTLKVYDVLGNEVAVLVNEWKEPGSYNAQFTTSGKQLASGMYFYTLTAGNFTDTKKFILLK